MSKRTSKQLLDLFGWVLVVLFLIAWFALVALLLTGCAAPCVCASDVRFIQVSASPDLVQAYTTAGDQPGTFTTNEIARICGGGQ